MRVEAALVQVGGQQLDRLARGLGDDGYRGQRRLREVEHAGGRRLANPRNPVRLAQRQSRDRARAAQTLREAEVAQPRVGGGDGRAAEVFVVGEQSLGGQAGAERDAPVENEQSNAVGERLVERCHAAWAPFTEL